MFSKLRNCIILWCSNPHEKAADDNIVRLTGQCILDRMAEHMDKEGSLLGFQLVMNLRLLPVNKEIGFENSKYKLHCRFAGNEMEYRS